MVRISVLVTRSSILAIFFQRREPLTANLKSILNRKDVTLYLTHRTLEILCEFLIKNKGIEAVNIFLNKLNSGQVFEEFSGQNINVILDEDFNGTYTNDFKNSGIAVMTSAQILELLHHRDAKERFFLESCLSFSSNHPFISFEKRSLKKRISFKQVTQLFFSAFLLIISVTMGKEIITLKTVSAAKKGIESCSLLSSEITLKEVIDNEVDYISSLHSFSKLSFFIANPPYIYLGHTVYRIASTHCFTN